MPVRSVPVRSVAAWAAPVRLAGASAALGRSRRGLRRRSLREPAYLRNQIARLARQRTGADQIAHAREFIQTGLHDRVGMVIASNAAAVDLQHQGLEFVAQIAHGGHARHTRSAFQRVQLALQLGDGLLVFAVFIPDRQRPLRSFQQLGRFFAVDVRYFVIECFRRRRLDFLGRLYCRRYATAAGAASSAGTMAEALVSLRSAGDHRIDFGFQIAQSRQQLRLIGEKSGRFIDVGQDVFDGAHRLLERREARIRQAHVRCRRLCA